MRSEQGELFGVRAPEENRKRRKGHKAGPGSQQFKEQVAAILRSLKPAEKQGGKDERRGGDCKS